MAPFELIEQRQPVTLTPGEFSEIRLQPIPSAGGPE